MRTIILTCIIALAPLNLNGYLKLPMATLTETAYYSRKTINLLLIVAVVIIILRIAWILGASAVARFFPPGAPPANHAFNKLLPPNAQNNSIKAVPDYTFSLETINGKLPPTPKTANVYLMPRPASSLDSFDKMKKLAEQLDFTGKPTQIVNTLWKFVDTENPLRTLEIDEVTLDFDLKYNYSTDLNLFQEKSFSPKDQIIPKLYLQDAGLLSDDLASGSESVAYFKVNSSSLVSTSSLSTADALSVTFNREKVNDLPVVQSDPRRGLVSVLISASSDPKKIVLEARYYHPPIQFDNFATYPVISPDKAFEKLKTKKALYALLPEKVPDTITIRNVYLAYLDPFPLQDYLQPVWVFTDQQDFVAYVPAVSSEWLVE